MRSVPFTRSFLIGLEDSMPGKTFTGRILAKRPKPLRRPRIAASGRMGALSHLGPPTEPKRIASLSLALSRVSGRNGSPYWSMAEPPTKSSLYAIVCSQRDATVSNTSFEALVTSGPTPSPGKTNILKVPIVLLLDYFKTSEFVNFVSWSRTQLFWSRSLMLALYHRGHSVSNNGEIRRYRSLLLILVDL